MPKKKKEEIIPHSLTIEWEGKKYEFRCWKENAIARATYTSPMKYVGVLCAQGKSVPPFSIQIPRMFGCTSLDRLKEVILIGFENQKKDRPQWEEWTKRRIEREAIEAAMPEEWHKERERERQERSELIIRETTASSKARYGW